MRIFVTGGTGQVGRRLVSHLGQRGDQVVVLTRRPDVAQKHFGDQVAVVAGDPMQPGDWMTGVEDCDAVVHLAGENVFARRWNAAFKQRLRDSRVLTTRNVVEALRRSPNRGDGQPKILVNASAIGYYGPRGDEDLDENSGPGEDFLARVCIEWEGAAREAEVLSVRVALVRIGVVLDPAAGALTKLLTPFKLFVGGPVGSGRQWLSWIHHQDLTGILCLALDHPDARGPLNGTAPHAQTNRDFSRALGKALHRPSLLKTPGFALRLGLGEVAHLLVTGQKVYPRKALALGYTFRFPTVDPALADLLGGR
jgi:uncharacterized protein (TIGR01777 family)